MNQSIATVGAPALSAWRLRIALLFFMVGVLGPVAGLLIRWMDVPGGSARALSRLLRIGRTSYRARSARLAPSLA